MADAIEILMPLEQEGSKSVVRAWLKKVGDSVKQDEPLVELETDKVAVEVPAPADGVLVSIALDEGDEAAPGAVLGVLSAGPAAADRRLPAGTPASQLSQASQAEPQIPAGSRRSASASGERETRLSPLVRRLIADNKLDASQITGSGRDGRITHEDIETHLRTHTAPASARPPSAPAGKLQGRRIAHDTMRKSIAEHMARSLATAPHVTAVFEADFSAISAHRAKHKAAYSKAGAPLTYSAYFIAACVAAMQAAPNVNSRWHDDALEVFDDVNIGIGVALGDKGLIVPVLHRAQTLSLRDVATRLADLTDRARTGKLMPADTRDGTFTISNHGVSGSLIAAPIIINQPQAAILGIGKLEKRVVVREINGGDAIVVRPMAYVSLSIDHRVLDGHQTNAWLTRFVETLEAWPQEDTI